MRCFKSLISWIEFIDCVINLWGFEFTFFWNAIWFEIWFGMDKSRSIKLSNPVEVKSLTTSVGFERDDVVSDSSNAGLSPWINKSPLIFKITASVTICIIEFIFLSLVLTL